MTIVLLVLISSTDACSCLWLLTCFLLLVEYCRCSLNTASCCCFLDDLTCICPSFHYLVRPTPLASLHSTSQGKTMCQCGKGPLLFVFLLPPQWTVKYLQTLQQPRPWNVAFFTAVLIWEYLANSTLTYSRIVNVRNVLFSCCHPHAWTHTGSLRWGVSIFLDICFPLCFCY